MSGNRGEIRFEAEQGSLAFVRDDDGGLRVEQVITRVDGKRDHLCITNRINAVDARRVFELLRGEQ